ncbi:MAG: macro domain-containing protein [Candidatus Heimdallarchaeota archaeon]|nr:macro domain-containing protein [Candidatus Heimdallarchaeota archaeon]
MRIDIVQGDITQEDTDAIVNAANSQLMHGGGVALAIAKAAGTKLVDESNLHPKIDVGSCGITTGGNLKAKYVIHAVGPRYGWDKPEESLLYSAIYSSLEMAESKGLQSIAFPAISTGIFGYPFEAAVKVIFKAMIDYQSVVSTLYQCKLVLYDSNSYNQAKQIFETL